MSRKRFSFSNVTAVMALVIALGGTSYAALERNSVTSKQLAPESVASSEVQDSSLTRIDLDPNLVSSLSQQNGGKVYAGWNDGPGEVDPDAGNVGGQLELPAGRYAIFAKLWVTVPYDEESPDTKVMCRLNAGGDSDETRVTLSQGESPQGLDPSGSISLMVVHKFDRTGVVYISCEDYVQIFDGIAEWNDVKIVAIQASSLTNAFFE